MSENQENISEDTQELATTPSFYTTKETDYLTELSQLVNPYPSGDIRDGIVSIRTLSLITGRLVMAIVVAEIADSFITILPYIIQAEDNGELTLKKGSPGSLCRIYKSIIGSIVVPEATMTLPYLMAVKRSTSDMPGFFNEIRVAQIDMTIVQLSESSKESSTEEKSFGDMMGARPGSFTPPEFFEKRMKH